MHCCQRQEAEGNSASGHSQHRGGESFDCCTERYEIVVLLPNALDKLLGQLGIYATRLSSIAYLQKQCVFSYFLRHVFSVITRFLIA